MKVLKTLSRISNFWLGIENHTKPKSYLTWSIGGIYTLEELLLGDRRMHI